MLEFFVQLIVGVLVVVAIGLRSVRLAPSDLSDYELGRRVAANNDAAKRELHLRQDIPLIDALRRLAVLVLTVIIIAILASTHNLVLTIVLALGWMLVIEVLVARFWVRNYAEKIYLKYENYVVRVVDAIRPALQLIADFRAKTTGPNLTFFSKPELLQAVDDDAAVLNNDEKLLIHQALVYQGMTVADVMTPRSVVAAVDIRDDTVGPILLDRLHQSGHSRFPVIDGDLDHVRGVLYMHNLVPLNPKLKNVSEVMDDKVFYVHQDKPLDHILQAFLRTKHHLFMVVNEFEEVTGVVSIEDVLEVIIGRKIVDEFDQYEDLRAVARLAANKRRKVRND